jgi:hypothetical protein
MHFILNHMFQFLIIDRAEESVELVCFACNAGGKVVLPSVGEAFADEDFRHVFYGGAAEGGAVFEGAV